MVAGVVAKSWLLAIQSKKSPAETLSHIQRLLGAVRPGFACEPKLVESAQIHAVTALSVPPVVSAHMAAQVSIVAESKGE